MRFQYFHSCSKSISLCDINHRVAATRKYNLINFLSSSIKGQRTCSVLTQICKSVTRSLNFYPRGPQRGNSIELVELLYWTMAFSRLTQNLILKKLRGFVQHKTTSSCSETIAEQIHGCQRTSENMCTQMIKLWLSTNRAPGKYNVVLSV